MVIQRKEELFKFGTPGQRNRIELGNNNSTVCKTILKTVFLDLSSMCMSLTERITYFSFYNHSS